MALLALGYALWRAQFGIELYDEPFYLLSGFKMFSLGDRPFVDEIHNGPRHYDLLNYVLARHLFPFDVLSLRRAAVLVYAGILALFTGLCFRKRFGLVAGVSFAVCLLFDYFMLPTWNHNWWTRNFLLLHGSFLILAIKNHSSAGRGWSFFLSGLCLGGAVVAYLPLVLGVGLALLLAWVLVLKKGTRENDYGAMIRIFLLGLGLFPFLDMLYFLGPSVREHWWHSVHSVVQDYSGGEKIGLAKVYNALRQLFFSREVLVLSLLLFGLGGVRSSSQRPGLVRTLLFVGGILYAAKRFWDYQYLFMVSASFSACAAIAAVVILNRALRERSGELMVLPLIGLGVALTMSFVSHNSHHAIFWSVPVLLIPLMAEAVKDLRGEGFASLVRRRSALVPLFLWVVAIGVGTLHHSQSATYFDAPIAQCTRELKTPPLTGIRTTERRAALIEKMGEALKSSRFAVSFGVPGAFYFSKVRSSTDSSIVNVDFPLALARQGLDHMRSGLRNPELFVIQKTHSWEWGKQSEPLLYSSSHPLVKFFQCARGEAVVREPELEIWTVHESNLGPCLRPGHSSQEIS